VSLLYPGAAKYWSKVVKVSCTSPHLYTALLKRHRSLGLRKLDSKHVGYLTTGSGVLAWRQCLTCGQMDSNAIPVAELCFAYSAMPISGNKSQPSQTKRAMLCTMVNVLQTKWALFKLATTFKLGTHYLVHVPCSHGPKTRASFGHPFSRRFTARQHGP